MATRILLLRHAMTSAPELFHGSESDVGLGETGRLQAVEAAEKIKEIGISRVYSSAMRRAIETARPIAEAAQVELVTIASLHERRMGPLSGTPWAETRPIYEASMASWMAGDLDATHPGGESYREIRDRVVPVFQRLANEHHGQTISVVAHGVVIRVLATSLLPRVGPEMLLQISIEHVAIHDLTFHDGEWSYAAEPVAD